MSTGVGVVCRGVYCEVAGYTLSRCAVVCGMCWCCCLPRVAWLDGEAIIFDSVVLVHEVFDALRLEGEQLEAYVCCAGVLSQAVYHAVHCGGWFGYVGESGGDHLCSDSFVAFDVFVYSLTFLDLTLLGQLLEINVVAGICGVEVNYELLQDVVRGGLLVGH